MINKTFTISISEVYEKEIENISVPFGHTFIDFRPPLDKESWYGTDSQIHLGKTMFPRLILEKVIKKRYILEQNETGKYAVVHIGDKQINAILLDDRFVTPGPKFNLTEQDF